MMIEIGKYLVSTEILTEYFCCDYEQCKGVCCIVGDSGAPLEGGEAESLMSQSEDYMPFMAEDGKEDVKRKGFSVVDIDGDIVTPLVSHDGRCAYSLTDSQGFTYCAVEKGFEKCGRGIRKPLSCWIFPIRLKNLSNGYTGLMLSREHLCQEAFIKGRKKGERVYQFLKEPLIYRFGEDFYKELCEAAKLL